MIDDSPALPLSSLCRGVCPSRGSKLGQKLWTLEDYSLTRAKDEWDFRFVPKELIDRRSCSRTRRQPIVIEQNKSTGNGPRIKELAAIQHGLINVDVYMRQGDACTFEPLEGLRN